MRALDYLASAVLMLGKDKWDIGTLMDIRHEPLFLIPKPDSACPIACTHEPDIFSTEIKCDYDPKIEPFLNQAHVVRRQSRKGRFFRPSPEFRPECFLELGLISLASKTINYPNHWGMKQSAFLSFGCLNGGMLNLNHKTIRNLDVGNMQLASIVSGGYLLPIRRKIVLPRSVPIGFRLPPLITVALTLMGPMPNFLRAALRDERCSAPRAEPNGARSGFNRTSPESANLILKPRHLAWEQ